jgi:uncharacterized membrane protein
MKRPVGFTVMALALGWLAIGGVANLFVGSTQGLLHFFALIYAITAIITAIGLWKMKIWAFPAYLAWMGAVILTMIAMQLGRFRNPWSVFLGFACFVIILLWLLARYVKRTLIKNIEHA